MTSDPAPSQRTIALVGLMGVGKSTIGRRLAQALELPFRDADQEIELGEDVGDGAARGQLGEAEFRAGERRVIGRLLLQEPRHVLATGGGAFMDPQTRLLMKDKAITVWLKADLDVLVRRVGRKNTRPLLAGKDPRVVLQELMDKRYPVYAEADITIMTDDRPASAAVEAITAALAGGPQAAAAR